MYVPSKNGREKADRSKLIAALSLTDVEIASRNSLKVSMADGHAAQYDASWWKETVKLLPEFEAQAAKLVDREAEIEYRDSFMHLFGQHGGIGQDFKILPNASWSIDVVMTLAARRRWKIQLIEPCFDNLFLYARERGLETVPLDEQNLRSDGADAIDTTCDMVVLVSPNNPTGFTLNEGMFREIAAFCARSRITLAIDASFRAYDLSGADHYTILQEEGCSYVVIEDTGKTFPTRERKASIVTCSNDLKRDINEICEIHVLGWSSPILLMLTHLVKKFAEMGLDKALRNHVGSARTMVRNAIAGSMLRPAKSAMNSVLPVEFIEILDDRFSDIELMEHLRQMDLGVLPGRHFFWSTADTTPNDRFIRISLLKEMKLVTMGAKLLSQGARSIAR